VNRSRSHAAPSGQFRVIACDTFEGPLADYLVGEFPDLRDAIQAAKDELSTMASVYQVRAMVVAAVTSDKPLGLIFYLNECNFRYNHRFGLTTPMFRASMQQIEWQESVIRPLPGRG
jgi:hypothetical protein